MGESTQIHVAYLILSFVLIVAGRPFVGGSTCIIHPGSSKCSAPKAALQGACLYDEIHLADNNLQSCRVQSSHVSQCCRGASSKLRMRGPMEPKSAAASPPLITRQLKQYAASRLEGRAHLKDAVFVCGKSVLSVLGAAAC